MNKLLKDEYGLPTTSQFEKEVSDMTAYTVRLYNDGRAEGRLSTIYELVQDGDCLLKKGAEKAGMDEAVFVQKMTEAGYKIPECV